MIKKSLSTQKNIQTKYLDYQTTEIQSHLLQLPEIQTRDKRAIINNTTSTNATPTQTLRHERILTRYNTGDPAILIPQTLYNNYTRIRCKTERDYETKTRTKRKTIENKSARNINTETLSPSNQLRYH